jgi:hypothetical protein
VLRGGRERHGEGLRQLAYRSFFTSEVAKHLSAGGIAEGMKDGIKPRCL